MKLAEAKLAFLRGDLERAGQGFGRAQSKLALGDTAAARIDLERARLLHESNPGEPVESADVDFTLARVLLASGEDARALELAGGAHRALLAAGHDDAAADIATWLETHEAKTSRPKGTTSWRTRAK